MNYYRQEQLLAQVDIENKIIGKVEKWGAHKKGILHRGYTALLSVGDLVLLQLRKHPVFDNVFDLSFSSHQIYKKNTLQNDIDAIYEGLLREWMIQKEDTKPPQFLRTIYYKKTDEKSGFTEHEIDYIYHVQLLKIPSFAPEFAYGFTTVKKTELHYAVKQLPNPIAPWVGELLKHRLF